MKQDSEPSSNPSKVGLLLKTVLVWLACFFLLLIILAGLGLGAIGPGEVLILVAITSIVAYLYYRKSNLHYRKKHK
ncbi:hypothetical protein [Candidatus Poriferisocius sp.]|uniref:hypothetical protein n=1 Tax=Candidatus Poriferisocius sp. TaxID=3101276 RepID=UPI003B014C7D